MHTKVDERTRPSETTPDPAFSVTDLDIGCLGLTDPVIDGEPVRVPPTVLTTFIGPNKLRKRTLLRGIAHQLTSEGAIGSLHLIEDDETTGSETLVDRDRSADDSGVGA
ncbi:hypothetical protein [Halarchaeum nitratireducens]|uniref:Uncharacterized protein n=1 Tax=Halarchaeum nitratireducens TaxID=489913 RepID=A0A830GDS1_9EURY|nr:MULTISPECIES: hypothetical protein [Halarchaeum]MBP2252660.1 hypothetical protein [Halarchaeum solikamskense]GGN24260.1 hypothetical protein GCM10009021_27560 [Halarchaeum nitratireducens]